MDSQKKKEPKKTCGNCIQCVKGRKQDGNEWWTCENYDRGVGMPFDVTPPNDDACSNWTDDIKDKDKPSDELRYFVDHFWDDADDWDDDWNPDDDGDW